MKRDISADFRFSLKRARVHDAEMAYVDVSDDDPIVFVHDNPISSYPWRTLPAQQKEVYLKPFREPGVSRLPTLVWPRQIPFDGNPPDTYARVKRYSDWLAHSAHLPKLFVNAEEGRGTAGAAREFCRAWPNQREISLRDKHYFPEDCPPEIGEAVAGFVKEVRSAMSKADTAF